MIYVRQPLEPPRDLHERHHRISPLPIREPHGRAQGRPPRRRTQKLHPALPRPFRSGEEPQDCKPQRAAEGKPQIRDADLADAPRLHRLGIHHGKGYPHEEPCRRRRFPLRQEHPFGIRAEAKPRPPTGGLRA